MEIVLTHQPGDRRALLKALETFAREHQLPARVREAADLALEEHITNILRYAYDAPPSGCIRVRLDVIEACLQVEIEDEGKPFNPLQAPPADTSVPLQRKPVGGLGIHLIRQFMDEMHYRRQGHRNILTLRKRLDPAVTARP